MVKRHCRFHAEVLLAVGLCSQALPARDPNQAFGRFSTALQTPHIKWAKPRMSGPLRVLVIAPTFSQRESVELWQRLECEVVPVMTESANHFAIPGGAGSGEMDQVPEETVLEEAEKAIATDWQVALVGKGRWDTFPLAVRKAVLSKVYNQGAGFVWVAPTSTKEVKEPEELTQVFAQKPLQDTDRYFAAAIPWRDLPAFQNRAPDQVVSLGEFGKGRIVALRYGQPDYQGQNARYFLQALTPHACVYPTWDFEPPYRYSSTDYDYYLSLLAKATLWAGRQEGRVTVRQIDAPAGPISRDQLATTKVTVDLAVQGRNAADLTLDFAVHDLKYRVESRGKTALRLTASEGKASVSLPLVKEGTHFLDVWLKQGDRTVDWASTSFTVRSDYRIESLQPDALSFERGQPITGKVTFAGAPISGAHAEVQVWDAFKGCMLRVALAKAGGTQPFSLSIPDPRSAYHQLVAVLSDSRGVVSEARGEVLVPDRSLDEFTWTGWSGTLEEPCYQAFLSRCRELGMDAVSPGWLWSPIPAIKREAMAFARLGLRILPYTATFIYQAKPTDTTLASCFNVSQEYTTRRHAEIALATDPFGPLGNWICEESILGSPGSNVCQCPLCLAQFRNRLKEWYSGLAALNQSWGTNLTDWSQATPLSLDEAIAQKQVPRWADFRRSMELSFTKLHTDLARAMLDATPRAMPGGYPPCGYTSYQGFDFYRFISALKEYSPALNLEGRWAASFLPEQRRLDPCYGIYRGTRGEDNMRFFPWGCLALGGNGAYWWHLANLSGQGGDAVLTPTLEEPLPFFAQTMEEVAEIKRGADKLLLNAAKADDGVRVLYSQMSIHAATVLTPGIGWVSVMNAMSDFVAACEAAGVGCRFVSSDLLNRVRFPQTRVLILPRCSALSDAEGRAIVAFAQAGGLVLADFAPGTMDEHLKVRERPALAALFPDTSRLKVNRVGEGTAAFAGDLVKGLSTEYLAGAGQEKIRGMLRLLEEAAGIKPRVRVTDSQGQPFFEARPVVFDSGAARYVLLLRERKGQPPADVVVNFGAKGHVYDVRAGKYLGASDTATVTIASSRAALLSWLPYPVRGVALTATASSSRRTYQVSATVQTGETKKQKHVFRLELCTSNGQPLSAYTRKVIAPAGQYRGPFTIALNEPTGQYRLEATDVASSGRGSIPLQVR